MPQTDTLTAPDASKSARSDKPAGAGDGKPGQDRVRAALIAAADTVMKQHAQEVAKQIGKDLKAQLDDLVQGDDPKEQDDPCKTPKSKQNPLIPGFCFAREQAWIQAGFTYGGSADPALDLFESAKRTWTRQLDQYDFSIRSAQIALDQAVAAAIAAYEQKFNQDSGSRMNYLYFTKKQAIAAALLAFEGSAATAGAALATATGSLIAAFQTYLATIEAAAVQQLDDEATAQQTFWQSVENVLDAP